MTAFEDQVNGRLTESRVGRSKDDPAGALAQWGSTPAPPACGPDWLRSFRFDPARLSNGLETDRQWYAFNFTACLIKGFCRFDVIAEALTAEGVYPVGAYCDGRGPLAMATLWFNLIHDSVCGSYHEVILSFDVNYTRADAIALRTTAARTPWAILYPSFGPSVCDAQFLHSLWINSPLSITWGREMQAFPKHPRPVMSTITDGGQQFQFDLRWGEDLVLRGGTEKRVEVPDLLRESWGLITANRPSGVLGFLAAQAFDVPILMPAKTAAQNNVPLHYIGHLWKGLHPSAVQVWPWGAGDVLELGQVTVDTGCEDHNGHRLLRAAEFQPVSVTYMQRAAALVEVNPYRN
jgi:hypothetical protein